MIRVTVELIPFGVEPPELIGQMDIANDGTGTYRRGNYYGRVWGRRRPGKFVKVDDFPRQSKNAWHLIARCLSSAGYR